MNYRVSHTTLYTYSEPVALCHNEVRLIPRQHACQLGFGARRQDQAGMDVKLAPATVGNQSRAALWAHPPLAGQAVVEFHVPVPETIRDIRLHLAIGIRDGADIAADNLVAFSVKLNGLRVWGHQSNAQIWQPFTIALDLVSGDIARVAFCTEALNRHEWTWAVWGEPELTGISS